MSSGSHDESTGLRRLIVVAGVILDETATALLVTRRPENDPPDLAGRWEFPGGKVEPGEEPRTALAREIAEELGIKVTVGPALETLHYLTPRNDAIILCYRCALESSEPRALQVAGWRWQPLKELDALDFLPADRTFVKDLADAARRETHRSLLRLE